MSDRLIENVNTADRWVATGLLVILLLATLLLAPACNKATGGSGEATTGKSAGKSIRGFTMVNETFPGEKYHVYPIWTTNPGMLYFYCRHRYGDEQAGSYGKEIKAYRAEAEGTVTPATMEWEPDYLDQVVAFLPNGFLWVGNCGGGKLRDLFFSDMKHFGGGSQCVFSARHRSMGTDRLLGETKFLPLSYSKATGAVVVDLDGYGGARVKTNDADPTGEGVQLMEVRAWGRGFSDGVLAQALVTADGRVYRFDAGQARLVEDDELSWLKRVLEVPVVKDNKADPVEFAFAGGGVLAVDGGTECVLLARGGATWKLEKRDVLAKTPDGKKRDEKELKLIAMDHLALRPEAYKLGTECLSENVRVIAVNDTRVAVYDHDYQRLVFIAAK